MTHAEICFALVFQYLVDRDSVCLLDDGVLFTPWVKQSYVLELGSTFSIRFGPFASKLL